MKNIKPLGLLGAIPHLIVLFIHTNIATYTRFIADDFCSVYLGERLGMLRYIWFWYITWGGRYTAIAADMPLVWLGARGIGVVPILAVCFWVLSLSILFYLVQHSETKNRIWTAVAAAIIFVSVLLAVTPLVNQSLYWYSGFRTHTLPVIGLTAYFAFAIWVMKTERRISIPVLGLSFIYTFLNGGFSETLTLLQFIVLTGWTGWLLVRHNLDIRRMDVLFLLVGILGTIVALVVLIAAPGNANRQSYYSPPGDIFTLLQIASSGYWKFLATIFVTPKKILGFAGLLLAFAWLGGRAQRSAAVHWWHAPTLLGAGLVLAFLCFPPAVWGTGEPPPERAQIIPSFFLLFLGILSAYCIGNQANWLRTESFRRFGLVAAVLVLSAAAYFDARQLLFERPVYVGYASYWDGEVKKILAAREVGEESIVIHSERNWAMVNDPNDNPDYWVNYCMSKYYEIGITSNNTGMQAGPWDSLGENIP